MNSGTIEAFAAAKEKYKDNPEALAKINGLYEKLSAPEKPTDKIHLGGAIGGYEAPESGPKEDKMAKYDAMYEKAIEGKDYTDEQKAQIKGLINKFKADAGSPMDEIRGFAGIPAENMTLGLLGDEARAGGRALVAKAADFIGGTEYAGTLEEEYNLALEDERRVEQEVYEEFPLAASATAIAFGIVPSAKIGAAAGLGKSVASGAARQGGAAAAEAGVYGFMEGEDLESRVKKAGVFATMGLALGGTVGGIGGGVAGRAAIRAEETDAALKAMQAQQQRLASGKDIGDGAQLLNQAEELMNRKATQVYQETGESLTGPAYTNALKETAQELGVSLRRIRAAEAGSGRVMNFTGKTADDTMETFDDFVPEEISRAQQSWYKNVWRNGITPIVRKGKTVVGEKFSGRMQVLATRLAQHGDQLTGLYRTPTVSAFQRALKQDSSGTLRSHILNMSNLNMKPETRKKFEALTIRELKARGGQEAVDGFRELRKVIAQQQARNKKSVNGFMEVDPLWMPSQVKAKMIGVKGQSGLEQARQVNAKLQKRGFISPEEALLYENPAVVADDWMRTAYGTSQLMEDFQLRNLAAVRKIRHAESKKGKAGQPFVVTDKMAKQAQEQQAGGAHAFSELTEMLKKQGADDGTAIHGTDLMRSLVIKGAQGPNAMISNFRRAAYMGTIGNPYSAVLNIGDTFNSMVNFGTENTAIALGDVFRRKGLPVTVDDIGMMNQTTGEFVRDGVGTWQQRFNRVSDASFRVSQFRNIDRLGKNITLGAAMRKNQQLAAKGYDGFAKRWAGLFNDSDTRKLYRDVLQNKKSNLTTEMAAAELSKMQPTDMASLPQWFLDHPNARVFYMLRTFGLKQLQQMEELIFEQWKQGNKKEAVKNALAYTMIVGAGNAGVNEARQVLKGDKPTAEGFGMKWADHMLGAASANTLSLYTVGRSINEKNPTHMVSGALPPLGMVFAPLIDAGQLASAESVDLKVALEESEMFGWAPWGRLAQSWLDDGDE